MSLLYAQLQLIPVIARMRPDAALIVERKRPLVTHETALLQMSEGVELIVRISTGGAMVGETTDGTTREIALDDAVPKGVEMQKEDGTLGSEHR